MARIRTQTASGKPTTLREFLRRQDPAWLADELLRVAGADPLVAARLKAAAGARRRQGPGAGGAAGGFDQPGRGGSWPEAAEASWS